MRMRLLSPSPELAPFVRTFEVIEAREETVRTLLPETGFVIGFRYAGDATQLDGPTGAPLPRSVVTGLRASTRRMRTSAGGGMVLAKLREAGAAAFFAAPLHRLFGAVSALDELAPSAAVERASQQIGEARSDAERVALLERFLLSQRRPVALDPRVTLALHAIAAAPASIHIGALARDLDLSQDALEKRFRRDVGTTPKHLASLVQLRRAIRAHRSTPSLTHLAHDAGYCDQSHFVRRFRAVTGAAPSAFLGSADYC
jgi:AraC-like DNA-binding protein